MTGPFFEDLRVGWQHTSSGYQVTEGHAALYQAISGDQSAVACDPAFAVRLGADAAMINPALVAQIAIGQSTPATREVVANLHYRDVRFHRLVPPGSVLHTTTTVLARRWGTARPDRAPRGTVLLGIETVSEDRRPVLSMQRLALVRARAETWPAVADPPDEVDRPATLTLAGVAAEVADLAPGPVLPGGAGPHDAPEVGTSWVDALAEPVTDAVALVRLTGNLAQAHRDVRRGQSGQRLVYGGHTLALAQAALSRLFADRVVVLAWVECRHPAPVFEGDLLTTSVTVLERMVSPAGSLCSLAVQTDRVLGSASAAQPVPSRVQEWQPIVLLG